MSFQALSESEMNLQGGGIEVILQTPNNGCVKILSPIDWPITQNGGMRLLKDLCVKQEVKKKGKVIGRKISKVDFQMVREETTCFLKVGGKINLDDGENYNNANVLVTFRKDSCKDFNDKVCYLGGNSSKLDRVVERFLCIMGS